MIINVIKKSFADVINNPAPALILVLFMIICNFLGVYMLQVTNNIASITLTICLLLIIVCFSAGWMEIFREIAKGADWEQKNPFGTFLEGAGKNSLTVSLGLIVFMILLIAMFLIVGKLAALTFGSLDFVLKDLETMPRTQEAVLNYITNLPPEKAYIIYATQLSITLSYLIFNFCFIFYYPFLIEENSVNVCLKPFWAIKKSVTFIFKNFFEILGLTLLMCGIYILFLLSQFLTSGSNVFSIMFSYVIFFLFIYFVIYVIMLVFNYYELKNNSNNGCDGIGENEPCNSISKED